MANAEVVLEARRLGKVLGPQRVLEGVDLEVCAGELLAIMGPNGAGKTTLLRCLAAATRPTSGDVYWFGRLAQGDRTLRRHVGMLGHRCSLYANLSVRENLVFAARMCGVGRPLDRVEGMLREAGLAPFADRITGRLSRGMRQRLGVLRATVHDPRIVLLDEPFSGLDDGASAWLLALIERMRHGGAAICCAVHDQKIAKQIADRVLWLRSGRLVDRAAG